MLPASTASSAERSKGEYTVIALTNLMGIGGTLDKITFNL